MKLLKSDVVNVGFVLTYVLCRLSARLEYTKYLLNCARSVVYVRKVARVRQLFGEIFTFNNSLHCAARRI